MSARLLRQADLVISPWPNGAGRKADVAAGPGWLVAFAWLDSDAPFSDYSGFDRTITLVDGHGFVLRFNAEPAVKVPFQTPTAFDGGARLSCHLPDGPCRVLNVMTDRGTWRNSVRIGPALPSGPGTTVLVALDAASVLRADGQTHALGRWDSVVVERAVDLAGEGVFATLHVRPAAAAL